MRGNAGDGGVNVSGVSSKYLSIEFNEIKDNSGIAVLKKIPLKSSRRYRPESISILFITMRDSISRTIDGSRFNRLIISFKEQGNVTNF